ncbi:MAG: glycoside hydrolase family 65 protein [Ilumatobacteraceae bacterium]|nr:glycoside hydrolase family 65 protein [Ilumatobacteraceae bacterium]
MTAIGEHVRTDTGWEVVDTAPTAERGITVGSNFMVGNGYLGYRGTRPDQRAEDFVACVVSDTYDMADGVWRELCTVPNALYVGIALDGAALEFDASQPSEVEYTLATAEVTQRWRASTTAGESASVSVRRFASLDDLHAIVQQVTVIPDRDGVAVDFDTTIDIDVWSLNGDHLAAIERHGHGAVRCVTGEDGTEIWVARRDEMSVDDAVATIVSAMGVASSNDDLDGVSPEQRAETATHAAIADGYRAALGASAGHWEEFWARADVQIDGDIAAQAALRFSILHNRIATPAHSDRLPIGARGLSCQAYQGAAFWDQEMFNLLAFLHTQPEIARNILMYRWRTLDGARRKARRLGFDGAYFAWISGTTGDELCPDFFFTDVLTGRPIRNHFNVWQMHVSPDVARAVWRYWEATNDLDFLADHGAEITFEVARFLRSFVKHNEVRDRYEVIRLLGPDEWHENVDNNAYTNHLSRLALGHALEIDDLLATHRPAARMALHERLGVTADERSAWRRIHDELYVPTADPNTGLIEAFDGFYALEDTRPAAVRERLIDPAEYWGWPNGVAPRCAHGSSLSHSVHASVAARLGELDHAYLSQAAEYFFDTATIDLLATQHAAVGGTFIGGIHTAATAGAYGVAVYGFGGVEVEHGVLRIDPRLPSDWQRLAFRLMVWSQQLSVIVEPTVVTVTADGANTAPTPLTLAADGRRDIDPGATATAPLRGGAS